MSVFRRNENSNPQRKYVDLIERAAGKWPNWNPPHIIRPGDFGTVNKETGELVAEGNIYSHKYTEPLAKLYPPIVSEEVEGYQIQSRGVQGLDIGANAGVGNVVLESQWQFTKNRGAILLMYKSRMLRIPDEFFYVSESLSLPILKGKHVVHEAWNCPGYYMYLSDKSSEKVTVSLRGDGANINSSAHFSWFSEGSTGVRQYTYRPDAVYTPLFHMKVIKKPLSRRAKSGPGDDAWYKASVPWGNLDDEGRVMDAEDSDDPDNDDD